MPHAARPETGSSNFKALKGFKGFKKFKNLKVFRVLKVLKRGKKGLFGHFGEAFGVEEDHTVVVLLEEVGHECFDVGHGDGFDDVDGVGECSYTIDLVGSHIAGPFFVFFEVFTGLFYGIFNGGFELFVGHIGLHSIDELGDFGECLILHLGFHGEGNLEEDVSGTGTCHHAVCAD